MFAGYIRQYFGQKKTGVIKLKHIYLFKIRMQHNVTIFNKQPYRKIQKLFGSILLHTQLRKCIEVKTKNI